MYPPFSDMAGDCETGWEGPVADQLSVDNLLSLLAWGGGATGCQDNLVHSFIKKDGCRMFS